MWEIQETDDEAIIESDLLKALKGQRPEASLSRATANPPLKGTDFLQEVDQEVKSIMKSVLAKQKESGGVGGTELVVDGQELYLVNQLR